MTEQDNTNAKAKAEARNAAERRLREAFPEDFRTFMEQEHEARGLEYKPRLTKEERARKEIERLARENGIRLAFSVETDEDAEANAQIMRDAHVNEASEVPEGTPTVDLDAVNAAREAQRQTTY